MIDLLAMIAEVADGAFDALLCFGASNSRKRAERDRIQALASSQSLHHGELRQKIEEPKSPFDPQMK
jgi:hypothetical protein